MSDQQSIPKNLEITDFIKVLGLAPDDFASAEKLNTKLFPNLSDSYKKAANTYLTNMGPSGTFLFNVIIKFYEEVYSKMDEKDIKDDIIVKFLNDNYGPKSPVSSLNLWLVKSDFILETISILKNTLKLSKPIFLGIQEAKPNIDEEDRAIFDPKRFGKKLGIYVGVTFGVSLLLCFMALSPSLIMNDFIYKPYMMRIILGLYAALLFIFIIPYYVFIGLANPDKSPKLFALFPIVTHKYEWDISNYLFGLNSWIPTIYDGNDIDIRNTMGWLRDTPHEKDLNPIPVTLESLTGS
jgi:hypothetical protein